jgi:carbonic anhydrase/acetyltransferase-like protein (isoleucine patch superfamily)
LIGTGAILFVDCRIGDHSLVGAGPLACEGFVVHSRSLVAGAPARNVRDLKTDEMKELEDSAKNYVDYVANHRNATHI